MKEDITELELFLSGFKLGELIATKCKELEIVIVPTGEDRGIDINVRGGSGYQVLSTTNPAVALAFVCGWDECKHSAPGYLEGGGE